jgi:predicted DCC family thiol-disulfide oxidoreductase YuxK
LARTPLLLYDGECGLCNAVVRFLLRRDRRGRLRFAALQGTTARAALEARGMYRPDFDSIVFIPDFPRTDGAYWQRTDGVVGVLRELGGGWRLMGALRLVPAFLRDPFYRIVARVRYRIFGVYVPRPLERPEWAERFLP